jgi:hypothetical protein
VSGGGGEGGEIPSTVDVWTLLRAEVYVYCIQYTVVLMCANMMSRPRLLILVRRKERVSWEWGMSVFSIAHAGGYNGKTYWEILPNAEEYIISWPN